MNGGSRDLVVGVDGGGTKTDVIVADLDGDVVATARTGGTNHEMIGIERMIDTLDGVLSEALASAGADRADIAASVFGLAGVDWPSDVEMIDAAIGSLELGGPRWVLNDSQIALRAGCARPWGIVSSVGTGSVTAGRNRDGRWFRTMAIGIGEPSGAGTIVRRALDAVAAHHHRTAGSTVLTNALPTALGMPDALAMFEAISRGRTRGVRHLTPVVTDAAEGGDTVARMIVTEVAGQHAEMVVGVADRLDMLDDEFELVTAGGVHASGGLFREAFAEAIATGCTAATIVPLTTTPALGAVSLALDLLGA